MLEHDPCPISSFDDGAGDFRSRLPDVVAQQWPPLSELGREHIECALLADVDNEFPAYRSTLGFFIDHDTFFLVAYLLRSARNLNFPNAFVQIASR